MEIGEYIRTKYGHIEKIKTIICNDYPIPALRGSIIIDDENGSILEYSDIVKHSFNIIDLIEVGDIVKVLINIKTQETMIYTIDCEADLSLLTKQNVKSIITKEQMKSVEYKIKEEK